MNTRKHASFFIESLVLTLLLLVSVTVLIQLFGQARAQSDKARMTNAAVTIARSTTACLAASDSRADFFSLLGGPVEREDETGHRSWQVDENGVPDEDGAYKVEVRYREKDQATGVGWLDTVEISVYAGEENEPLYTLESQKYRPGA